MPTVAENLANGIPASSAAITPASGSLIVANGSAFSTLPAGNANNILAVNDAGALAWTNAGRSNFAYSGNAQLTGGQYILSIPPGLVVIVTPVGAASGGILTAFDNGDNSYFVRSMIVTDGSLSVDGSDSRNFTWVAF